MTCAPVQSARLGCRRCGNTALTSQADTTMGQAPELPGRMHEAPVIGKAACAARALPACCWLEGWRPTRSLLCLRRSRTGGGTRPSGGPGPPTLEPDPPWSMDWICYPAYSPRGPSATRPDTCSQAMSGAKCLCETDRGRNLRAMYFKVDRGTVVSRLTACSSDAAALTHSHPAAQQRAYRGSVPYKFAHYRRDSLFCSYFQLPEGTRSKYFLCSASTMRTATMCGRTRYPGVTFWGSSSACKTMSDLGWHVARRPSPHEKAQASEE